MFSENTFQKNILVDIKRRILMGSGQQVNNRIQDFTIRISFTRSNSRLPSSMVIRRRLSGTMDKSQLITVVFPEPVEPAMQTETP